MAGNRTFKTSQAVVRSRGSYNWTVRYSGDKNNVPLTIACDIDSGGTTTAGDLMLTLTDSLDELLLDDATGTIIFTLFGPDDTNCTQDPYSQRRCQFTVTAPTRHRPDSGRTPSAPTTGPHRTQATPIALARAASASRHASRTSRRASGVKALSGHSILPPINPDGSAVFKLGSTVSASSGSATSWAAQSARPELSRRSGLSRSPTRHRQRHRRRCPVHDASCRIPMGRNGAAMDLQHQYKKAACGREVRLSRLAEWRHRTCPSRSR